MCIYLWNTDWGAIVIEETVSGTGSALVSQWKLPLTHILNILLCNAQMPLRGQLLSTINLLFDFLC